MAPTLLIGLDGATFSVLDPYVERGVMPFLGSLTERGTRAGLRSIMPPLTPPAWTSMVTGKRPGGLQEVSVIAGAVCLEPVPVVVGLELPQELEGFGRPHGAQPMA